MENNKFVNDKGQVVTMKYDGVYVADDGFRKLFVKRLRWTGDSHKYIECLDCENEKLRWVIRAEEIREATEEEKESIGWKVVKPGIKGEGITEEWNGRMPYIPSEQSYLVDPITGKKERCYRFDDYKSSWKYSSVTGDEVKDLLKRYGLKHIDVARHSGIIPKNFRERYLVEGKPITEKTWFRIRKAVAEMLECDEMCLESDIRAIRGEGK